MKLKQTSPFLILLFSLISVGCATVMSGETQEVTFQSTPDGATVKVNGKPIGKTPLTTQLDKKAGQTLTIEKEGYKTFTTSMDTTLDSWFWGNIVLGGFIGSTTDSVTGSMHRYSPGQYFITLEPEATSSLNTHNLLSQKEEVRRFLFLNYSNLKKDLSSDSGEYVNAMLNILNIQNNERDVAVKDIKAIIFNNEDPAGFVSQTIKKYLAS